MKYGIKKRILSFFLCISVMMPMITSLIPVSSVKGDYETLFDDAETLKKNIGSQGVFEWVNEFLFIDEETLMNSTAEKMAAYYGDAELGYQNWVGFDEISANDLVFKITDYHYDEENGFHWYKIAPKEGETLPQLLLEKPWVYYGSDSDIEFGVDPYLVIYDKNDTIRIVNTSVNNIDSVRFVLSSASVALKDATVSITDYEGEYSCSSLSFVHEEKGIWSNALQVCITKANGEIWSSDDGVVSILYTSEQIATNNYEESVCYGAAFLYIGDTVYSANVTDKMGYDLSDVVFTNSGISIIVYEFLPPSFEWLAEPAYFKNESVVLYDNQFNTKEYLTAALPVEFIAGYSFIAQEEEYYWLEDRGLIGSSYFLAKASDVVLGKLPEEFGDGRVNIVDQNEKAITAITLPMYEKKEYTAVSSLAFSTAYVDYRWQVEYEDSKWVDIYGEDEKTIKISFAMFSSLLGEKNVVNIRCCTRSASAIAYSLAIPVTPKMDQPEQPDVVVSDRFVSSSGETVTVTVVGSLPEDASIKLEETDSEGVDLAAGETVMASVDISVKNADGTEWQPQSGETVEVTLEASKIGLQEGDSFVVYHLHNGETRTLGTYVVTDDQVKFTVDGFSKFVFALASEEVETPDFSGEVGKHATLTKAAGLISVVVLDAEPTIDNIYSTMAFDVSEFSGDTVFSIDEYKVIHEYYDICDEITGELIGKGITQWLWYRVSVVGGKGAEDFEDGYWILQNYLTEADALEADTLTLFVSEEEPEEPADSVYITVDGEPVTEVSISNGNKVTVTANTILSDNVAYKWQIYICDGDMWVNISGQTKDSLTLSTSMVGDYTDDAGVAYVRCITASGSETYTSAPVAVTVIQTMRFAAFGRSVVASASPLAAVTTAEVASEATEYVVTVLRQYENGKIAAATWSAQQIAGTTETYTLILPDVVGYVPWIDTDGDRIVDKEAPKNSDGKYVHEFTVSSISANVEMKVIYKPGIVNYTVIYMFQNVYDDDYTPYGEPEIWQGLTDSDIDIEGLKKSFNGMEFFSYDSNKTTIASDGSTVIKMHYDRNYYLLTFDLDGGQGVEPIFARYGTPLNLNDPTRFGYTFSGWEDENGTKLNLPSTMPAARNKYVATWTPGNVSFVVVFWYENADPEADGTYGYTYVDHESVKNVPSGTTVNSASYKNYDFNNRDDEHFTYNASKGETITVAGDGSSVLNVYFTRNFYTLTFVAEGKCVLNPHTHGNSCYEIGCGLEVHTHENCEKTENAICGKVEHTQHNSACYSCVGYEHSHSDSCCEYGGIGRNHWYHRDSCCTENKTSHTHNSSCYKDSLHTHTDSCYSYDCGKAAHTHSNSCNVLICTQNEHTHDTDCTNSNRDNVVKVVTKKYDADITDIWPIVDDHNKNYKGYDWESSVTGKLYAFLEKMPGQDITMTEDGNTGTLKTWYYYLETLSGENYDVEIRTPGDGRTYYYYLTSSAAGWSSLTYDEDYFPITGFRQRDKTVPSFSNNTAYLYYVRNTSTLTFYNYNKDDYVYGSIPFGTNLNQYNYTPKNPLERPEGAYEFQGWYLTHECVKGTEVDLSNMTMPDGDLILYAKWQPVEHTVKVFNDANLNNQISNHTVLHGDTFISASEGYVYDPTVFKNPPQKPVGKEDYDFVYWFYMDNGVEKTFDYESTPITKDMNIYAKWMTKAYGSYSVYYKLGNINGPDVATPIVAESVVGVTKTFEAKIEGDLYSQYQSGFFPDKPSTAINIEEDAAKNVVYFIYTEMPEVPYTVHYYDANTNQPLLIDGVPVASKVVDDNKDAVVVEDYKQILGYVPDAMQKRLVLSSDSTKNVIVFYYTKDTLNAPFQESHYIQNIDGKYNDGSNGTLDDPYKSNQSILPIGTDKEASQLTIPGFTFDSSNVNNVTSGEVSASGLKLKLYYSRNSYPYMIRHVIAGTGVELVPSQNGMGLFEAQFIGYPKTDISGYRCTTSASVTQMIQIESGTTPVINVITFEYEEIPASLNYVIVDPNGKMFDKEQSWGGLSSYTEEVGMMNGFANGSTAFVKSNVYKFVGWYSDEACENLLRTNATYVPAKEDGILWEDGTTYYAKFEYNLTSLTIEKAFPSDTDYTMDPNQTFIFQITGNRVDLKVTVHGGGATTVDGLTAGETYTITEKTEWSWRYRCNGWSHGTEKGTGNVATITIGLDGTVTFTNERTNPYWFDGDSWCNNIFKAN